jgi:hypothetical protein
VGLDQYKTHLPTELVWVHVGLACLSWLAALWAACEAGALRYVLRSRARPASGDGALRGAAPLEFPGN